MNATNTTTPKNTVNPTAATNEATVQACCQGAQDAFKAGVEANQNLFNSFMNAFTKTWNMDAFKTPMNTVPAAFDKLTKAMNAVVDSNARFMNESSALAIDAVRTNVRTFERTGDIMLGQLMGQTTCKSTKPAVESAREVFDEACSFASKASERLLKMNTDHVQNMSRVMDEMLVQKA